jgi:mRNA-degrading endonuclease RelE of RelBE toxin-antitoxin system
MTFAVDWTRPAQRDLARLPARIARAVVVYVDERLAENRLRLSKDLNGELAHARAARSGDVRVLFTVDEPGRTLHILRVDHRAHVYRPR